jgi:hypothetical protein
MEYFGFGLFGSALKSLASSQRADQPGSTACGSYADGMGLLSVIWTRFYLGGLGKAGARVPLVRVRRPGYVYVYLLAAHGRISLYPAVQGAEEAFQVVAVHGVAGSGYGEHTEAAAPEVFGQLRRDEGAGIGQDEQ